MDPDFLPATSKTISTADKQQHQLHDHGFRYRKYGGEIYDPKQNKKRRLMKHDNRKALFSKHDNNNNNHLDSEFDFPDSPPKEEEEKKQNHFDDDEKTKQDIDQNVFEFPESSPAHRSQQNNDNDNQETSSHEIVKENEFEKHASTIEKKEEKEEEISLSSVEVPKESINLVMNRDSNHQLNHTTTEPSLEKTCESSNRDGESSPTKKVIAHPHVSTKETNKTTQALNSPPDNKDEDSTTEFSPSQPQMEMPPPDTTFIRSTSKGGESGTTSQRTIESVDTADLPQTADFALFLLTKANMTKSQNNKSDHEDHFEEEQKDVGSTEGTDEHLPDNNYQMKDAPTDDSANKSSSQQPESIDTAALPQVPESNSQLPESIDTAALPQTADFGGRFSSTHNEWTNGGNSQPPESIDTAALPQTADFAGRFTYTHNQSPNDSNSQPLPDSIDTAALPQTADFGQFSPSEKLKQLHDSNDRTGQPQQDNLDQPPSGNILKALQPEDSQQQSIDTAALPQTADFGRFPSLGLYSKESEPELASGAPEIEEKIQSSSGDNVEKPAANGTVDEGLDQKPVSFMNKEKRNAESRDVAINSNLLPSTTEFGGTHVEKPPQSPFHFSKKEGKELKIDGNQQAESPAGAKSEDRSSGLESKDGQNEIKMTKTLFAKTPAAHSTDKSTRRRITPPSVSLSERAKSRSGIPSLVLNEKLCTDDDELVRSLRLKGVCIVLEIKPDTIESLPKGDSTIIVFDAASLMSEMNPFTYDESSLITICNQSFAYLVGRLLGWRMLSSECLGELQRGSTALVDYSIWGDAQLYNLVARDHNVYPWHKKARWWGNPLTSPSESSVSRCKGKGRSILSKLSIVVTAENAEEEKRRLDDDKELLSRFIREGIDDFQDEKSQFQGLRRDEVRLMYSREEIIVK